MGNDPDTVRAVSTSESLEGHQVVRQAVNLIFGLAVVCGLLLISVLALGHDWLGVVFGAIEVGVASWITPPIGARSLRWITAMFGAFTLTFSVLWLILS
jgi:hypothetical protein